MIDENFVYDIDELVKRYPSLDVCKEDIFRAFNLLKECFLGGHKLLIAGNGGSNADAEHIVGELMKGFKKKRRISIELEEKLQALDLEKGKELASKLEPGLPAISLSNHQGLNTAFINDVENGGEFIFAEQLLTYGQQGDVFLAISTSGNSKNIYNACLVAKARGLKIIGLTGSEGGKVKQLAHVCIKAPAKETFEIQEYHLPIYHLLCLMLESYFFK